MTTNAMSQGWTPDMAQTPPASWGGQPGLAGPQSEPPVPEVKEATANEKFAAMPGSDLVVPPYALEPWKALRIMGALMPIVGGSDELDMNAETFNGISLVLREVTELAAKDKAALQAFLGTDLQKIFEYTVSYAAAVGELYGSKS